MNLAQTNLEVNTDVVFITDGLMKFYKTKCELGVVSKNEYDARGRNCMFYSFKTNKQILPLLQKMD